MSSKIKPWLLLAIIFIVGIVTGVALTIGLGPRFAHVPGDRDMKRHWMTHLTTELNLTADQQAKIQPILADADAKLQSLRHEQMRQGAQVFKAADDQIAAILTPEQQVLLKKMQDERQKMFSGRMRPPGGMFNHDGPDNRPPPPAPPPEAPPQPEPPH